MTDSKRQDFLGTERFLIQDCLGTGGFGAVYRAFDREQNAIVALKTLTELEAEAIYAFKNEFRSLADVIHPNLVELYELFFENNQWFFTMELVEGENILNYVWQSPTEEDIWQELADWEPSSNIYTVRTPLVDAEPSWKSKVVGSRAEIVTLAKNTNPSSKPLYPCPARFDRLRSVLQQLAEGLNALHEAGKLHRDIKPSNILITKQGRLVILDFGLVMDLAGQKIKAEENRNIVGTPSYMSPEQAGGQLMTEATDWYSVGVLLYEALTKDVPFVDPFDPQPIKIILNKLRYDPTPPSQICSDIPPDLESLCLELLSRHPNKRPTGAEVLRRLTGTDPKRRRKMIIDQARLIGREEQLEQLNNAFSTLKSGKAVSIYVQGNSGMGKSAFIRYFLDGLQRKEEDLLILTGRCYEQEFVPYKALDSLMDSLANYLKSLSRHEIKLLISEDLTALARIFPVFNQVEEIEKTKSSVLDIPNSQELRQRAFLGLRELLTKLGQEKLLILYVDDLQWGDGDSATLLQEILRMPNAPKLMFLASYRNEELDNSLLLKTIFRQDSDMLVERQDVELTQLSWEDSCKLARMLLEDASAEQIETIAREAAGSPFFIGEFIRYSLLSRNFSGSEEAVTKRDLNSLDEIIQKHISELPENGRNLLEILAIAGQPLDRKIAKHAAKIKDEDQIIVNILKANRLIRAKTSKNHYDIEIYHNRIREAVIDYLPVETLKNHHANLAETLEALSINDPQRLAHHFSQSGNDRKAIKYVILAAEQASCTLAFNQAAQLYRLALDIAARYSFTDPLLDNTQLQDLRIKLADSLSYAGQGREAAKLYLGVAEEICDFCITDNQALKFQQRAAEEFLRSGHIDNGIVVLSNVLSKVGIELPTKPWQSLLSFLFRRLWIEIRGRKTKENSVDKIGPEKLLQMDICWTGAIGLSLVDSILGADFQTRYLLLALQMGEPYRLAKALSLEIPYSAIDSGGDWSKTNKLIDQARSLAEKVKEPYITALVDFSICVAAFLMGDWKKSYEMGGKAEKIFREHCTGVAWELSTALIFTLRPLFYIGEWDKLFDRVTGLIQEAQNRGDLYTEINLRIRLYYLMRLASDQPEKLEIELREALEQWSNRNFHVQHYWELVCQVETTMYRGEGEEGWIFLNYRWKELKKSQYLRVQFVRIEMWHLRARSALSTAAQASEKASLLRAAEKDARKIEKEKREYGDALALLIRAGIAATKGQKDLAIKLLEQAEEKCNKTDMYLFATAACYRKGQLMDNKEGAELVENACQWMKKQQIKCPEKMFDMIAPGKWQ